ncbi:MAG: AbrB/MazE/SpoVT family DNA-binding domain-containing protein [Proteobacteria bacterium]|jgi:bifunctional DNA-binding transcriptional regulator/antitoxin component of YhaV-PrlF toxin-antitoxin module|nr:AbrB/MazE/SpoVT family DNA-binding domain-containing protein [Pseudomonadota bacterium]
MPQINSDGTITIPKEIVKNMEGKPGDNLVFEEWLEPDHPNKPIEDSKTFEVSVMLRSEWDKSQENRALPLRKLEE